MEAYTLSQVDTQPVYDEDFIFAQVLAVDAMSAFGGFSDDEDFDLAQINNELNALNAAVTEENLA